MKRSTRFFLILIILSAFLFHQWSLKVYEIKGYTGKSVITAFNSYSMVPKVDKWRQGKISTKRVDSFQTDKIKPEGLDFLVVSSNFALQAFNKNNPQGNYKKELVAYSPLVIFCDKSIVKALENNQFILMQNGLRVMNVGKLFQCINDGKSWADIGVTNYYGKITISCEEPTKSDDGILTAVLAAGLLNGGNQVDKAQMSKFIPNMRYLFSRFNIISTVEDSVTEQFNTRTKNETVQDDINTGLEQVMPGIKKLFNISKDDKIIFNSALEQTYSEALQKTPMIIGLESNILTYADTIHEKDSSTDERYEIIYISPTVWATHTIIAFTPNGEKVINAIKDEDIKNLLWEKLNLRTEPIQSGYYHDFKTSETVPNSMIVPSAEAVDILIKGLKSN